MYSIWKWNRSLRWIFRRMYLEIIIILKNSPENKIQRWIDALSLSFTVNIFKLIKTYFYLVNFIENNNNSNECSLLYLLWKEIPLKAWKKKIFSFQLFRKTKITFKQIFVPFFVFNLFMAISIANCLLEKLKRWVEQNYTENQKQKYFYNFFFVNLGET